jgi:hypothetical protein
MKGHDFQVVWYHEAYYCTGCLPDSVDVEDEEVTPVFATDELDAKPCCIVCGEVHDYMSIRPEPDETWRERWETLPQSRTSPSGKTLFRCRCCKVITVAPNRTCTLNACEVWRREHLVSTEVQRFHDALQDMTAGEREQFLLRVVELVCLNCKDTSGTCSCVSRRTIDA